MRGQKIRKIMIWEKYMIQKKIKRIIPALMIFSAVLIVMAAPDAPSIDSWINDKTDNNILDFEVNVSESVRFDATANQTIDTWRWFIDNAPQESNTGTFVTSFSSENTYTVKVEAKNVNGTSLPVTWNVIVSAPSKMPPIINSWSNNKTNDNSRDLTINVSEGVRFNVAADQTIDAWRWFIDNAPQESISDTFVTSFSSEKSYIIKVEAINANGTSLPITWNVSVSGPPKTPPIINSWSNNKTNDNSRNFTIKVSESVFFNATADQTIDKWRWFVDGKEKDNNTDNLINSFTSRGIFKVKVEAINNSNGTSEPIIWNVQVIDVIPPANITDLNVTEREQTNITWKWKNPEDADFNGNRIFIDGSFRTNLPNSSIEYSATGLTPNTSYIITVIAFDTSGNNATQPWPENSSTTLPNTLAGKDIIPVGLPPGVIVRFSNVETEGNTTIIFTQTSPIAPDFEPLGDYLNIETSANFTGSVTIELNYDPPEGYNESSVHLYHLDNSIWKDVTTDLDQDKNRVTGEVSNLSLFTVGVFPPPKIDIIEEPPNLEVTVKDSLFFDISVDQEANVTWKINGNISRGPFLIQKGGRSNFTFPRNTVGNYSITVEANNHNGTSIESWNITVYPRFFFKGNRVWDGSKPDEFSLAYTWTPMSFSGFYYDIEDDVGDESITIELDRYDDRTIDRNDLVYKTTPDEVSFDYPDFGEYEVIGFMAEKYFAGYTGNTHPPNPSTSVGGKNALNQGQLHKVLIDDDTRRTISLGGTVSLKEGYVLKAEDIDAGARTMLISLLKDGDLIDTTPLSAGQTYVYTKRVRAISDLPIIMVRFDSVFSGREVQAAFLRGMFQISESYATVHTGNRFGNMEVKSVSRDRIEMRNDASISLSQGSTQDVMGDIKIIVADNRAVRFALTVQKTGSFEVRSSIYREDDPTEEWTPYNFGMNIGKTSIGFYYDLDEGIGNEKLSLVEPLNGQRTIRDGNLIYSASPQEVSFGYSGFGEYEVIGFMADKYFAGYSGGSRPPDPTASVRAISTLAQGQLHRVLIDDDTSRTVSLGSTITLKEGYVLKAEDIDPGARTMLISLFKDGNLIDTTPLAAGRTYVYIKKVGAVSDLPIIMLRFDSVFSGRETSAAFIEGIFQISEDYAMVDTGKKFGKMDVQSVSNAIIEMSNDGSISLDRGEDEVLMGNLRLRVGDTKDNSLRFYFAVEITPDMVSDMLIIDAPAQANAGEGITIKVTAGGEPVEGASIEFDSSEVGRTGTNGSFDYDLPDSLKGIHNITATKLGYLKAIKSIEVQEYIERRLSIESPITANQFDTITLKVTSNGTNVSGATMKYDNITIGTTDGNGSLNYTLETSGSHSISASRSGYITVVREIEVRAPFSDYKALDINISPNPVFTNENIIVRSNITNAGTKKDSLPVELIINGTVVDNRSVALSPGEIIEINFTRKEAKAGNYSVEILGKKELLEVKQGVFNLSLILIVFLITGLGVIAIYFMTTKNKMNLELIKRKLKFGKE
jgi:S-layer protein (TIGR01567 family)